MKKLLFICTGNTCRSTMAEALFKKLQSEVKEQIGEIHVISAGTGAVKGDKASPQAIEVMRERGVSLNEHRAVPLTKELIDEAELILTMTTNHKRQVLAMAPQAEGKVFTLREYAGGDTKLEKILDEMNEIYKQIESKKREFIQRHQDRLTELKSRRKELIRQLEAIDNEVNGLEGDFRSEIKTLEEQLQLLEVRMPQLDVRDPFGQPIQIYRQCANEIEEMIRQLIKKLNK